MRSLVVVVMIAVACAESREEDPTPATAGAGGAHSRRSDTQHPGSSPSRRPAIAGFTLTEVSVDVAEDGAGRVVPATRPIALELQSDDGWPGRALDPVLHVGSLHYRHYEHPAPGILRFVAADAARLPRGAEVWLQWGDDTGSRITIAQALEVTP